MSTSQKSASPQAAHSPAISYSGGCFRVLSTEDHADYERLLADLDHEYEPISPTELLLVEHMAQSIWLHGRAQTLHDACWDQTTGGIVDGKKLLFYVRQVNHHQESLSRAVTTFMKLRKGMRVLKRFSPLR